MTEKEINSGKKSKILLNLSYIYLIIPFVIFVIGWIKWYYAILMIVSIIVSFIFVMRNTDGIWIPDINKKNIIKMSAIFLIITAIVCLSGIGNFVWQNTDHEYRNAIFRIMVEDKWPLINFDWNQGGSGLIYYIGFWLPAAVVGKIFNLTLGYYFQVVWAITGILIVYYLICVWLKKISIWPLVILFSFSGLDIVGFLAANGGLGNLGFISHIEWWSYNYQYSSVITQLFWVFNQSIPVWCITMMMFIQDNSKNLVFLLALSMLSSTLPFIGLIPLVIYFIITKSNVCLNKIRYDDISNKVIRILKEVCSIQNIIGGGIIGIISFLYLRGNSAGQYIENVANDLSTANFLVNFLIYYLFCFLEAGIYLLFIYKYQIKNSLFYLVGICLFIIPLIRVGTSADFCMRASIPALFILILLIIDTLLKSKQLNDYKTIISIIIILVIGSVTPMLEINRTIFETYVTVKENGKVENNEVGRKEVYKGLNFSGDIEDNIFYEIFVK